MHDSASSGQIVKFLRAITQKLQQIAKKFQLLAESVSYLFKIFQNKANLRDKGVNFVSIWLNYNGMTLLHDQNFWFFEENKTKNQIP